MSPEDPQPDSPPSRISSSRFALIFLGILLVLALVQGLLPRILYYLPSFNGRGEGHRNTKAINNAKQIGTFLFLFEQEYGTFPSLETAESLRTEGIAIPPGESSNAYLKQLILSGFTTSEEIFYNRLHPALSHKPDSVIDPPTQALAPGEVGFAYITRENGVPLTTGDDGGTPIVIDAYAPGATRFDPDFRDRKAIYLSIDQSVQIKRLDSQGRIPVTLPDKTESYLFDPKNPLWEKGQPVLHQPLPAVP